MTGKVLKVGFLFSFLGLMVVTGSVQGALYINEFMASNVSTILDGPTEYDDWVEIYNSGDTAVDMGGMYLTDDLAVPTKCQIPAGVTIPAHGYLLFWFDGQPAQGSLHINTKLSKSGEEIGLYASDGSTEIDSKTFGPQADDVSFGRQPDGGDNWVYFDKTYATPGTANSAVPPAGPPQFSLPGGLYTGTVTLTLSVASPPPGMHIYYTLDGSEPTNGVSSTPYDYMPQETRNGALENGQGPHGPVSCQTYEYTAPISISSTTVVRARVYATNYMSSDIITHTYLINLANPSNLAVVSVSSPPRYLWGNYRDVTTGGILVMGPNLEYPGSSYGGPYWYNMSNLMADEWNRPGHVEFYEPNGTMAFNQDIEIRSGGSSTQLGPQKPMVLYAVGGERFNYKVFPDLDLDSFRILVLHMSGDDWPFTQFRDATVHGLLRDIDVDTQGYRPAVVYVNGAYYGCMSIRERRNKDYVASHHDVDPNNLDILDNWGYNDYAYSGHPIGFEGDLPASEGDTVAFQAMINDCFIGKDLSQAANYAAVKQRMEIDEYLDWITTEIIVSNCDWPGGNVRVWRPRVTNGRFRWTLVDADYSFNIPALNSIAVTSGTYTSYDMITHATAATSTQWYNPPSSTYIFRRLLTNAEFKSEFIRRVADHLNITFDPTRTKADIDAKKAAIYSEMTRTGGQIDRWKNDRNPWTYTHISMPSPRYWMVPISEPNTPSWPTWDASVQRMKDFADAHPAVLRTNVSNKWSLGGTWDLTFNISPSTAGKIKVNRLILPIPTGSSWTGKYFKSKTSNPPVIVPIQIAAIPERGYRFTGWTGISGSSVTSITPSSNLIITANFTADAANDNAIVINEINYNSAILFDTEDWVEFYNPHDHAVDISGWQFKDSNDNAYTFPPHTTIGPGAYLVLCNNETDFHSLFPIDAAGNPLENYIGNFTFKIDNEGDTITLYDAAANLIDSVTYDDIAPWPTQPDGTGPTLELKNPALDNFFPGSWAASTGNGTPGTQNSDYVATYNSVSGTVTYDTQGVTGYPLNSVTIELHQGGTVESHIVPLTGTSSPKSYSVATLMTGTCDVVIPDNPDTGWFGDNTHTNVTIAPTTTVNFSLTHALPGDADMDGQCWDSDIDIVNGCYGIVDGSAIWCIGDFDGDGNVYDSDVDILNGCYGLGHEE